MDVMLDFLRNLYARYVQAISFTMLSVDAPARSIEDCGHEDRPGDVQPIALAPWWF